MNTYKIEIWDGYIAAWDRLYYGTLIGKYDGAIYPDFEDKLLPWYWVKVYK